MASIVSTPPLTEDEQLQQMNQLKKVQLEGIPLSRRQSRDDRAGDAGEEDEDEEDTSRYGGRGTVNLRRNQGLLQANRADDIRLSEALPHVVTDTSFSNVDLQFCTVGSRAAALMSEALEMNPALVELRLNHCTNVHGRHFRRVLGGLAKARESGLTDVILDSNQLDDNDVVELASSLGGESWHANDHPRPPSEQKAEEEGEVEGEGDFDDFEVGGEDPSRHHGPEDEEELEALYPEGGMGFGAVDPFKADRKPPPMIVLHLTQNRIGDRACEAIADALLGIGATLQQLILDDNRIGDEGVRALGEALEHNTTVGRLSLALNRVGPGGCSALFAPLGENKMLQDICLRSNRVGASGANAIAQHLKGNKTIQRLDLRDNNIGALGYNVLVKAADRHPRLRLLELRGNNLVACGCKACLCARKTQPPTHLEAQPTNVWTDENEIAVEKEDRKKNRKRLKALRAAGKKPSLEDMGPELEEDDDDDSEAGDSDADEAGGQAEEKAAGKGKKATASKKQEENGVLEKKGKKGKPKTPRGDGRPMAMAGAPALALRAAKDADRVLMSISR